MIELKVEDYCQNCKNFEPIKNELYIDFDSIYQVVTCEHAYICDAIFAHICNYLQKEKNND
jgi:hypothetical protein